MSDNLKTLQSIAKAMDNPVIQWAAAEIARLREERRWIPVGERLPQNEDWVDIAGWWGDCVGYYSVGRWLNVDDDPCWDAITHWRKRTAGPGVTG